MEAEARSVNDIPRAGTRRYPGEKVYGCTASVPPPRGDGGGGGLLERRIEFYFRSGESGSPLALPAAEEHQLIRRFSYSYSALPITPLRPVVSTKHLVSVEASLRLETRRVSFLSSFPYWFTDQASKRYDPFLLFSPSPPPPSPSLCVYICACLFHFISLASSRCFSSFLSFFLYSRQLKLFVSFLRFRLRA